MLDLSRNTTRRDFDRWASIKTWVPGCNTGDHVQKTSATARVFWTWLFRDASQNVFEIQMKRAVYWKTLGGHGYFWWFRIFNEDFSMWAWGGQTAPCGMRNFVICSFKAFSHDSPTMSKHPHITLIFNQYFLCLMMFFQSFALFKYELSWNFATWK